MKQKTVILIVDDEPTGRETLAALLHTQGYYLAFAEDGYEAISTAAAVLPDVILLDVMMPGLDGYEVCRRLRSDALLSEVPILLITALDDRESLLAGIEAGADDFISKPFDRVELRARIRTITRLNRYRSLLNERARIERMIELSPNGVLMLSADGTIRLANRALQHVLGTTDQTLVGETIHAFLLPAEVARFMHELHKVLADTSYVARFASVLLRAGHEEVPVELDIGGMEWNGAIAAQVNVRDMRDRKKAEVDRRTQFDRLAALNTIDTAIASSLDINVTLNVVLDQLIEHLHVSGAAVLLRRAHAQIFDYRLIRGFTRSSLHQHSFHVGVGFAGRVVLQRHTLSLVDLQHEAQAQSPFAETPAIYYGVPLIVKGQVEGVLEVTHTKMIHVDAEWLGFLETVAGQAAIAIEHVALFDSMQRAHVELSLAYTTTLEGWARALELRDKETEGHAQRVTGITLELARLMGISEAEIVHVHRGALLHDIGKMGIPDSILLKPGPLTDEEWQIMRQHPQHAYEMLAPITYLRPALDIPYCHHERWDGTGYPRGLKGEAIPLSARVFAVVDVWDALRFDRPYRKSWPEEQVLDYIQTQAGTHFDAKVVSAFIKLCRTNNNEQRLALLVVDDDPDITDMLRRILESSFTVFTATNSDQALATLSREQIAVLITDQRMPDLTGVQLLDRARHISPATLGVLSSGYLDNTALTEALNLGNVRGYIQKPWNIADLRRRISEVAQQYKPWQH